MIEIFQKVSSRCSKTVTESYSTSFSAAIRLLHPTLRTPVYHIYGFVRLADEIVDSFHGYDKEMLLGECRRDTFIAISRGISTNPILNSFCRTVNKFSIPHELIEAFFDSMEMDLHAATYDTKNYSQYIYGSAESVGLMCLYVFCNGDIKQYNQLRPAAQSLGAAFQKVNFLRDARADYEGLGRTYFPGADMKNFTTSMKVHIEKDIEKDFAHAYKGILELPVKARFGVYVAYKYYYSLFNRIRKVAPADILAQRIRIPNYGKLLIVAKAGLRSRLNIF